jgi:NADH:ubiquinone oxidoreductase subunit 5 (subunit L)/multisubunit Na+/H+ antiporter MnhA subunit
MTPLTVQLFATYVLALTLIIPSGVLVILGAAMIGAHLPSERRVHQMLAWSLSASVVLASGIVVGLIAGLIEPVVVDLGTLIAVRGYHFDLSFRADILGAVYLWLDLALCGLIGAFSAQYLHQDEGYYRFYLLLLAFAVGLAMIATGAGLDLVFAGWEIVGLTSALLIAFFVRRPAPVENGLRAYAVYRITDIGLLLGIVALHHHAGTADLAALSTLAPSAAVLVGGLLVFGAMGKGAIIPFTPWLPRAMEGPTPSSAIFYGALSIHASPFLLLRIAPVLEPHLVLQIAVVTLGAVTAFHATMVGRVQTDVKSSLGYASVAQVGVMWVWIGLGLSSLATVHLVGHAVLRTWQLLRAPSLLHDRHQLVQRLGTDLTPTGRIWDRITPASFRRWSYRIALERWYLDDMWGAVARTVLRALNTLDAVDRRWANVFRDEYPEETLELRVEPLEAKGR